MKKISIKVGDWEVAARLNDSSTAGLIWDELPITAQANTWGEEVYFEIPVKTGLEEKFTRDLVAEGDLGYWPEGHSFCIFFGETPASKKGEIRPASPVNIIGKLWGDPKVFKKVTAGSEIRLAKYSPT